MISLSVKIRETKGRGKGLDELRERNMVPAVLYGPKKENTLLSVGLKEFEKVYQEAGENTLIGLEIEGKDSAETVLIHQVQSDPITGKPVHIDFFQPLLTEEIETEVPLVFEGESEAVNNLGGTLVKNLFEIEVKSLPQNIPSQIKVDIGKLNTLEDEIFVRDLIVPENVELLREPDEIVATISVPEKVEEELEKPIEEKVEEVEKVEKKKEEREEEKEETEET